ncbi:DUF2171 domain-containing protein [Methylobacterium isbiliense]|uniref:DUF2171 domain-containing protein n=1 Tax=Methylobacterium isbiliense TaxID=315478 RepID=A0ABQ4SIG7_9HYPH|nr:DUF2171 domain-containing protein [Methylobacterium isbiliense]MDN3626183.1 DUF2171 domain-containing protein [Methylobacterium isbiliense]GJE02967.1 hypothetical protein GMJLKIPL_4917 [Methylobacterium isbiliense]
MFDASEIKGHMEVLGSDGQLVGTVDHLDETDRIKLVRKDRAAHDPDPHYSRSSGSPGWIGTST